MISLVHRVTLALMTIWLAPLPPLLSPLFLSFSLFAVLFKQSPPFPFHEALLSARVRVGLSLIIHERTLGCRERHKNNFTTS